MGIIAVLIAAALRLTNLGYSNYQGDEIKALFNIGVGESLVNFLLQQRKGPVQFIVTGLIKLVDPTYSSELLTRLPFALAGILAVFVFYKLIKIIFSAKVAFYAALFMATNGFFIGFARIVQYQSFVILFGLLALLVFAKAAYSSSSSNSKNIVFGFIFWALSILSHYDGIFIAPFAGFLLLIWFRLPEQAAYSKVKILILSCLVSGLMLALFYLPFFLSITADTKKYWLERVEGAFSKVSSSSYLFSVYHPIYVIHLYRLMFGVSLFALIAKAKRLEKLALFAWLIPPLFFMEYLISIPGTHIYTYLMPVFVLMATGIEFIENMIMRAHNKLKYLSFAGLTVLFSFLFLQSYFVFVDNNREYPWENEQFFIWEFSKPSINYHLSLFGFPYYRDWESISKYINENPRNGYYDTNERPSLISTYFTLKRDIALVGYYVYTPRPQSFLDKVTRTRVRDFIEYNDPIKIYYDKNGRENIRIYYVE